MKDDIEKIERKITAAVQEWNMFPDACPIVVGLSGGADSIALTHLLMRRAVPRGHSLIAAHVNHELRGKEAESDEQFVRSFCSRNHVELRVLRADIRSLAEERSQGIEECGRGVRYSFFRRLCAKGGRIATAHTLSDSAETVLMNLAKGAGARGLCGIPPVRGNIVRPLIGITRAEVERYCAFYGLEYVTDSTNLSADCARNRIRLKAVPALKEVNPAFEECVRRTTSLLRSDESYFERLAREKLREARQRGGYSLAVLRGLPQPVLLRAVFLAVGGSSAPRLSFGNLMDVARMIRCGRGSVTVAGRIQCSVSGNTFFVGPQLRPEPYAWSVPFHPEGTVLPDGRTLSVSRIPPGSVKNPKKINNFIFNNLINYDTILSSTGVVRNKRAGDVFRPAGRGVTKTLKKLFNEEKIPAPQRGNTAVLEIGGTIVWIEGIGVSEDARASLNSRAIAEITIKECK